MGGIQGPLSNTSECLSSTQNLLTRLIMIQQDYSNLVNDFDLSLLWGLVLSHF